MRQLLICIICLLSLTISLSGQKNFAAMTYNIRMETEQDGPDQWEFRKERMVQNISTVHPDFLGIQEGLRQQVEYLDDNLKEYKFIGVGRDDGSIMGEHSALFYDASKWSIVEANTFWLSETPEKVSMGWDAVCNRVCTHGLFENGQGDTIGVFNTHLDHMGKVARKESVLLLLASINQYAERYPVLLIGDFNFTPNDPNYQLVLNQLVDSKAEARKVKESYRGTYNGFDVNGEFARRIDYIFLNRNKLKIKRYQVPDWRIQSRHVSDHFPVIIHFKIL